MDRFAQTIIYLWAKSSHYIVTKNIRLMEEKMGNAVSIFETILKTSLDGASLLDAETGNFPLHQEYAVFDCSCCKVFNESHKSDDL